MRTAEAFAGIGGISLAFEKAGFTSVYLTDKDEKCAVTLAKNSNLALTVKDITRKSEGEYQSVLADLERVPYEVLLAGFPCQSFSQAGRQEGLHDRQGRGLLVLELLKIVAKTRPVAIFWENVPRLTKIDQGRVWLMILEKLAKLGYAYDWRILSSVEFGGVPQQRQRLYLVAFADERKLTKFAWPAPRQSQISWRELLEPTVAEKYYYFYRRQQREVSKPLWWTALKDYRWTTDKIYLWRRCGRREYGAGVCPTLLASMGTGGHNVPLIKDAWGVRKLTPRECARLQGFPDSFVLPATLAEKTLYQQLGNTVTLPVVERIAKQIKKALQS